MSGVSGGRASYDFGGRTVLVTGASRGIGLAVARAFCAAGGDVHLLADEDPVNEVAAELSARHGGRAHALRCDVTDAAALRAVTAGLPPLDVLVNHAGIERLTPLLGGDDVETEQVFRRVMEVNVVGAFNVTRVLLPRMSRGACIVFTCSIWSRTAVPEFSAYCASKHAVLGMLRSAAMELAPHGIRVNGVCPGWVHTDPAMASLSTMAGRSGRSEQALLAEITAAQCLAGLIEPEDIAATYLFLASDAAANKTGQALMADRGEVMA